MTPFIHVDRFFFQGGGCARRASVPSLPGKITAIGHGHRTLVPSIFFENLKTAAVHVNVMLLKRPRCGALSKGGSAGDAGHCFTSQLFNAIQTN